MKHNLIQLSRQMRKLLHLVVESIAIDYSELLMVLVNLDRKLVVGYLRGSMVWNQQELHDIPLIFEIHAFDGLVVYVI